MKTLKIIALVLLYSFMGCNEKKDLHSNDSIELDLLKKSGNNQLSLTENNSKALEVALAAITSPNETYKYYNELLQYISVKINRPIHIVQRKTYDEVNKLISESKVDIAFICSGAYVSALENNLPMDVLTIPIIKNRAYYFAYLIVNQNSNINSFSELKGKSFAFTDPISNTGYLYGLYLVQNEGSKVEEYFRKTIFTYGHDYSIQAVERNLIDGATVNSLIYDYIKEKHPERVAHTKILRSSEPFGIPPVVYRKNLDLTIRNILREVFINIHKDPKGAEILKNLLIDRYSLPDSTDYSSIIQKSKLIGK